MKARLFPRRAARYNDVMMRCPLCHKNMVFFEGFSKTVHCSSCGGTFKDKRYKEHTAAFKRLKGEKICG